MFFISMAFLSVTRVDWLADAVGASRVLAIIRGSSSSFDTTLPCMESLFSANGLLVRHFELLSLHLIFNE